MNIESMHQLLKEVQHEGIYAIQKDTDKEYPKYTNYMFISEDDYPTVAQVKMNESKGTLNAKVVFISNDTGFESIGATSVRLTTNYDDLYSILLEGIKGSIDTNRDNDKVNKFAKEEGYTVDRLAENHWILYNNHNAFSLKLSETNYYLNCINLTYLNNTGKFANTFRGVSKVIDSVLANITKKEK